MRRCEGPSAAVYVPQLTGSRRVQLEAMHLLNGRLTQNAGDYHRCSHQTTECQTFPGVSGIHEAPFPTRSSSPKTVLRIATSWLHLTACEKNVHPFLHCTNFARALIIPDQDCCDRNDVWHGLSFVYSIARARLALKQGRLVPPDEIVVLEGGFEGRMVRPCGREGCQSWSDGTYFDVRTRDGSQVLLDRSPDLSKELRRRRSLPRLTNGCNYDRPQTRRSPSTTNITC